MSLRATREGKVPPGAAGQRRWLRASSKDLCLHSDECGAVLVMAVFMSVFLVAALYFVVGVGEAVFRRQGLGDGADAAAFAAAILHARGMNLIAFINLVMAALLAVLVALRVVQAVCVIGIAVCVALAYPTGGVSLEAVQPLANTARQFGSFYENAKEPIFRALKALHQAERVTSYVVPAIAVLDSALEASRSHLPTEFGVALPGAARLPVEPDSFDVLCGKAGRNVAELVMLPLGDSFDLVKGPLTDAAESLSKSSASYFCGGGGAEPPKYTRKQETTYPEIAAAKSCETDPRGRDCRKARHELEEAQPDDKTGNCRGEDCSLKGPYERHAREARRACRPRAGFRPQEYVWQEQDVVVQYTFRPGAGWVRGLSERVARLERGARTPCGPEGDVGHDWALEPHPEGFLGQLTPLCAQESEAPSSNGYAGEVRAVPHLEVSHLFSCTVQETKTDDPMNGEKPFPQGDGKEPHRVLKDAELGEGTFQLRALVWGGAANGVSESALKLATWGAAPSDTLGELGFDTVENIAVAQAEYYYDHDGSEARSEWLWNMKWTARLVRFHLSSGEGKSQGREKWEADSSADAGTFGGLGDVSSFAALCDAAGFEKKRCSSLDASAGTLDGLVLH